LDSAECGGRPNQASIEFRLRVHVAAVNPRGAVWGTGLKQVYTANKVSKNWGYIGGIHSTLGHVTKKSKIYTN
jgi:hypothetical protein